MNISETEPTPAVQAFVDNTAGAPDAPVANDDHLTIPPSKNVEQSPHRPNRREFLWLAAVFAAGLGSGYVLRGWPAPESVTSAAGTKPADPTATVATPIAQIALPDEFTLAVAYGDIGPQLLEAGAIDYDRFVQVYQKAGQPLAPAQLAILTKGSDRPIVFNRDTAYFLLNFFWAAGLVNQNPILTEGPMMQDGAAQIGNFASTGGWTLATKPITELYAGTPIITLTPAQQAHLEEVAAGVYRPCCNNPTSFPDCNHGMAMLGLLELMASQDVSVKEMFEAAKYVNAFWFPQQTRQITLAFQHAKGENFAEADARKFVGPGLSSASGIQAVHQWLAENDLLEQIPNSGNRCGV